MKVQRERRVLTRPNPSVRCKFSPPLADRFSSAPQLSEAAFPEGVSLSSLVPLFSPSFVLHWPLNPESLKNTLSRSEDLQVKAFFFWSSNPRFPKAVQASKTTQYSKYNIQQAGFYEIRTFSNLQSISLHDKSHVHTPKNTLPKPQIIALVLPTIHLIFRLWLCFRDRHRGSSLGLHSSRHPHTAVRLFPSSFSLPPQSREISKVLYRAEHYLEAFIFSAHFWGSSEQFNSWNRCLKSAWIIFSLEFDETYSTFKDCLTGKHTNLLMDQEYMDAYPFLSPYLVTGGRETADYTIDVTVSDT